MTTSVKVLQLTDLHLRADSTVEMQGRNVQAQVDALFEAVQKHDLWPADLILLTGDIADEKEDSAFQEVYLRLAQVLATLNVRICAIPGNHDHPALLDQVFSQFGIASQDSIDLGHWLIVALDSSVADKVSGELDSQTMVDLDKLFYTSKAQHLLIAIHHPLIDIGSHWLDQIRTLNGERLVDQLSHYIGSKLVLSGHAHQEFDSIVKGIRMLGSPAACPVQFKPDSYNFAIDEQSSAGYRWCILNEDGSISTLVERV